MQLASIRIITDDLDRLVSFYEHLTGVTAERPAPPFAELVLPSATLAIGQSQTVALFGAGSARAADNHSMIIEFRVTTSTPNTHACSTSSRRGSRNQPRCRGATAPSFSAIPTETSSICSHPSQRKRSSAFRGASASWPRHRAVYGE